MLESSERINFITNYMTAYENKIKALNSAGLFDAAKLFETFALNICHLYFGIEFINLNIEKMNYPYVDLISKDGNIYCQVSTCSDVPQKIKNTLNKIRDSKDKSMQKIKTIYFFVLDNNNVDNVEDFDGDKKIGNIAFHKNEHLITTKNIVTHAIENLNFQQEIYNFLKQDSKLSEVDFHKYQESVQDSKNFLQKNFNDKIGGKYYIDLNSQIKELDILNKKNIFIVGEAGSGKSVLCKKVLENKDNVLFVRAEKLASLNDIDDIWKFNISKLLPLIKNNVYIYIDALEFISDNILKLDLLNILFERIKKINNVHIIASCRSSELASFSTLINNYDIFVYEIKQISNDQLDDISTHFPSLKPIIKENEYKCLLSIPFYLDKITQISNLQIVQNINDLRNYLWHEKICLGNTDYVNIITGIVIDRATNFRLGSSVNNYKHSDISKLISNDVLIQDKDSKEVRLKYDIFEDICFEQYIDKKFDDSKGNYNDFFTQLETLGRCVYRRYQIWIENKLFAKETRMKFLYSLVFNTLPLEWKKQTEIGIIKSKYCNNFFEENENELINQRLFFEFVKLTNIYGFSIKYSLFPLNMILKESGNGRRCLINILAHNLNLLDEDNNKKSIEKLLIDFSKETNIDNKSGSNACSIIIYLLKKYEKISEDKETYYSYYNIKNYIASLYRLNNFCDSWIKNFFNIIKNALNSKHENVYHFSDEAINEIIFKSDFNLIKKYNNELYSLINLFYFGKLKNSKSSIYDDFKKKDKYYGLNENGQNYQQIYFNNTPKINIFYGLFKLKYFDTLKWLIDLSNNIISNFKDTNKIKSYKIYFVDSKKEKTYYGVPEMWYAGENSCCVPEIFSDLFYCVKLVTFEIYNKIKDCQFAEKVKNMIINDSNNIMCLSILSNFGLRVEKELSGYCIDFISNIDLVLEDITKRVFIKGNPSLFKNNNFIDQDLREYARNIQFKDDIKSKNKCYKILDYLYTIIPNDVENAERYLQIQNMDFRNASVYKINDNNFVYIPQITGEAEKLVIEQNKSNSEFNNINNKVENLKNNINSGNTNFNEIDDCIIEILKMKNDLSYYILYQNVILFISYAFSKMNITSEKRDEYCNIWLNLINDDQKIIISDECIAKFPLLFSQINENITSTTKNKIKLFIIEKLLLEGYFVQYNLKYINCIKKYLKNNKNLANLMVSTILMLAKDEMNHQIFNYKYLKKEKIYKEIAFEPNMQPRLNGVDMRIKQEGKNCYSSRKNEIIEQYLYKEEKQKCKHFDIKKYDINILSSIFICGFDLTNSLLKEIATQYIDFYIKLCAKKEDYIYDIIDIYKQNFIISFFESNFKSKETTNTTMSILFDKKNFDKFTSETIDFYIKIINTLAPLYFDSYNDKEKRDFVKSIIEELEKYITHINIDNIKQKLLTSLILGFDSDYDKSGWSNLQTNYTYNDKMFFNKMFSKYGYFNFNEMIFTIYKLQYQKLLPEILISIDNSFKKYFIEKNNIINNNIESETLYSIKEIMFYSYVNYEKEIKKDNDLINSFESILQILIEKYNDPKAAILLDEFRIH